MRDAGPVSVLLHAGARWWLQKLLMDDQCGGHGSLTVSPFHALRERTALPPCLPLRGRPCSAPPTRPPCILFVEKANLAWARSELLFRQEAIVCRELKLLAAHSYAPPSLLWRGTHCYGSLLNDSLMSANGWDGGNM